VQLGTNVNWLDFEVERWKLKTFDLSTS